MSKKYRKSTSRSTRKSSPPTPEVSVDRAGHVQLVLPIAEILAAARESLDVAMGEIGLLVMNGLIQDEVTQIVGEKNERCEGRNAYRWGQERHLWE